MHTAAIFVISDSRSAGTAADRSGPMLRTWLADNHIELVIDAAIPDEQDDIREEVQSAASRCDLVITTGGTGVGPRDVTPEAVMPLLDKALPGFGEILRVGSYEKTPLSIISRGGAGVIGNALVVMLPGSPKGVGDGLELLGAAIKHTLKVLSQVKVDCQQENPPTT